MEVKILSPQGFCAGVTNAINMAKKAKDTYKDKTVYILGMLVHNKEVIDELTNQGIITLSNKNKSLEELIKEVPSGSVIVFTAHGHDEKLDEVALKRGLIIIDATCSKVKRNIDKIKTSIKDNRKVIYIGVDNHPETIASLSVSKDVLFYNTKLLKNNQITTNDRPIVLNQTTLNVLDLKTIHDELKMSIPNIEIEDEICPTTRLRQQALTSLDDDTDLIIIVGDQMSNNSKKLLEIAKHYNQSKDIIMISKVSEFDTNVLNGKRKVVISSGASTPNKTINDLYNLINQIDSIN